MDDKLLSKQIKVLELDKILTELSCHASTPDGVTECLAQKPCFTKNETECRLQNTSDAYMLTARFGAPSFGGAVNCNNSLSRSRAGAVLNFTQLLEIASLLRVIRTVKEWRDHFCSNVSTSLDDCFFALSPNKYFEEKLFSAIRSDEDFNDNASQTLFELRRKIRAAGGSIREKLEHIIRSQSYQKFLQDAIVTQRDGRFVVPVKAEYRAEIPGLVHDASSSGATLFIEPMPIVEVNNELRVLRKKEADEVERLLAELSAEAADFADGITESYKAVVALDVVFAKAKYAFAINAVVPDVNDGGICDFKNARHPLLGKKAVPISVSVGKDFDTLIVTGPNTGGKTVSLKTVGLLCLMAMCGLMLPVDDGSTTAVFGSIFADIGDEQSIEQSLSTFSSHMKNIVEILKLADSDSLVLLDELGAGTDPVEGAALAVAIITKLRELGAKVVTTTHYAELKSFAIDTAGVENACCEFDVKTLRPTYRLLIGVPGRSNAFAVSRRLGLPEDIITNANSLVSEENKRFESVVSTLEDARQTAEKEREEVIKIRSQLEKIRRESAELKAKLRDEREQMLKKTREQIRDIVDSARAESNALLNQLEDMKKKMDSANSRDTVQRARTAAKKAIEKLEGSTDSADNEREDYTLPRSLRVGDSVLLADINRQATVVSLPDKNGKVQVLAGAVSLKTDIENIRLCEKKGEKNKKPIKRNVTGVKSRAERTAAVEVDLRGMASDEALLELDRFIDNAVLSGISEIRIIHGKGTGVLRKAVQQELRLNKSVRTFRLGVFGEGENGVTIAELK